MISNTLLFSNSEPLINKICFSVCLVANELGKKNGTQPSDGYTKQGYFTISYLFDCL